MAAPREGIEKLMTTLFQKGKLNRGQVGFDHVIKDYGEKGTTCGYLPHWMLWRMGCTEENLVSRDEPDTAFKYYPSYNIDRVSKHWAYSLKTTTRQQLTERLFGDKDRIVLKCGDLVIVQGKDFEPAGGKPFGSEHIFVVLSTGARTANTIELDIVQAGGGTDAATQSGERKRITVTRDMGSHKVGSATESGPLAMVPSQSSVGARPMSGYLNIDQLSWSTPRIGKGLDALNLASADSTDPALQKFMQTDYGNQVGSIWNVSFGKDLYYYAFYKGHRVFYASQDSSAQFRGSGVWFTSTKGLKLVWDVTGCVEEYTPMFGQPFKTFFGNASTGQFCTMSKLNTKSYLWVLKSFTNNMGMPITA